MEKRRVVSLLNGFPRLAGTLMNANRIADVTGTATLP